MLHTSLVRGAPRTMCKEMRQRGFPARPSMPSAEDGPHVEMGIVRRYPVTIKMANLVHRYTCASSVVLRSGVCISSRSRHALPSEILIWLHPTFPDQGEGFLPPNWRESTLANFAIRKSWPSGLHHRCAALLNALFCVFFCTPGFMYKYNPKAADTSGGG
jgi:hypothetical protein